MNGNPALPRPKAATQNFAKIAAAFLIGLVTVFASALVYSNLEQRKEMASAVPSSRPKEAPPLEIPSVTVPENKMQDAMPSLTRISPEVSKGRDTAPLQTPAQAPVVTRRPITTTPVIVRPEAIQTNKNSVPLPFGPNSNVAPQLPPSALGQANASASAPEHYNSSVEPGQHIAVNSSQAHSGPAPVSVSQITVPVATTLTVRLADALSSDRNQPGTTFRAVLAAPLIMNGYLVAEAGSTVRGRIEMVRKSSLFGGRPELGITLMEISTWDGQRTQVRTGIRETKGARAMTGGSGLIAKTRAAVLPAGAQLTFILTAPLTITGTQAH